uniref:Ig-like domain-containing protein n=1 Tax=Astyanax mexicanus TaxID=7994 RepID=A0A8B9KBJ4_ASTMX
MSFGCEILSLIILLNNAGSLGETVSMTCRPQSVCALRESDVQLECSYSGANKPQQSFWFSPKQKYKWRNSEDPEDLKLDPEYTGRVSYRTNKYSRYSSSSFGSTLTIKDLRERDSGKYYLMLIMETGQKYSSTTAVTLTVSDLQTKIDSDTKEQKELMLNCSTSCKLTSEPNIYNWYTNGSSKYTAKSQISVSSENPGSYSCAVDKIISSSVYLQVKASPSPPSEGQAVMLTCSSTCTLPNNPTYIWYRNGEPVNNKPTSDNKLYLESASPEEVLQYSCALGDPKRKAMLRLVTVGVPVFLALTLIGFLLIWRRVSSSVKDHKSTEKIKQCDSTADVYSNVSSLVLKEVSDDPDDLHYSSLYFKHSQSPPPTSSPPVFISEEQSVEYAAVNFSRHITAHHGRGLCVDQQGTQAAVEEHSSVCGGAALVFQQLQHAAAHLGREGSVEVLPVRHEVQQHLSILVSLCEAVGDVQRVLHDQLLVAKPQSIQLDPDVPGGDVV